MNCKRCGKPMDSQNSFCPNCGEKVTPENLNKKKKVVIGTTIGIILVSIIISGFVFFGNRQQQKFSNRYEKFVENCMQYKLGDCNDAYKKLCDDAEKAISQNDKAKYGEIEDYFEKFGKELITYQEQLEKYAKVEKEYQDLFDSLEMEQEEAVFSDLKEQLSQASEDASLSAIEDTVSQLETEYEKVKEKNLEKIRTIESEINDSTQNGLMAAEIEIINNHRNNADQYKDQKNYKKALLDLGACVELCQKIQLVENYNFSIEQIDVSYFPKIKLYVSSYDSYAQRIIPLKKDFLTVRQLGKDGYTVIENLKVSKLNQQEQLNTCLVADVSGSMYGLIDDVEDAMYDFVSCLQFEKAHDEVSLITFDDNVYETMDFTNDKTKALATVGNLYVGNSTSLYDALYVAVCKTSNTKGAKCVMAFTDGYDNTSTKTAEDVIKIANTLGIPIYLIGIGSSVENYVLNEICERTGGFFRQIWNSNEMTEIYKNAFEKNKEMYLIEYDSGADRMENKQNIYVSYDNNNEYLRCESEFVPAHLQATAADYEDIVSDNQLKSGEIENEVLRIRAVYNDMVKKIDNATYVKKNSSKKVVKYLENSNLRCVVVGKGVDGISYTRYYYYENGKLMFAYLENKDSHRLYFYNDKLFRWRYAKNAVEFSEADNHDNEDSPDFRKWQDFVLEEAYQYLKSY